MIGLLNSFFCAAATLVEERGGIVAKHVGGALSAAFNAPLPVKDHAARRSKPRAPLQPSPLQREVFTRPVMHRQNRIPSRVLLFMMEHG